MTNLLEGLKDVRVFQGGMGVGSSSPELANATAVAGSGKTTGITSATLAAHMAVSKLANRDPGYLRALDAFETLIPEAAELLRDWLSSNSVVAKEKPIGLPLYAYGSKQPKRVWASIFGSFAVTYLAGEDHDYPIGVNVLEKVQLPHLECFMGTILAMTFRNPGAFTFYIAGAGLAWQFPKAINDLATNLRATYQIDILEEQEDGNKIKEKSATREEELDLRALVADFSKETRDRIEALELTPPPVIGIVTTFLAAKILEKKSKGGIAGFVVENEQAGGHNAPPRNGSEYGEKDAMDFGALRALGKPFWLAGNWGTPEGLADALTIGARGIQVGSLFALCREGGFVTWVKERLLRSIEDNSVEIERDDRSSPTGYPFNIVRLPGTIGVREVSKRWKRSCDIGHLRTEIKTLSGRRIYRCPAEPIADFKRKGGDRSLEEGEKPETEGRECLCRQLSATAGVEHHIRRDLKDAPIVTFGLNGPQQVREFLRWLKHKLGMEEDQALPLERYSARMVVEYLLQGLRPKPA